MKLYENTPEYVRLDDDVSFQIVRTNPKLATNTKLMYDGENLYMEAYEAAPILSTQKYKHHKIWKTGLYNRDIRNFLLGCGTAAQEVGQAVENTVVLENFDNQFENMYWCGVEAINSDHYPQEMGCIAPLYLRKKRPNYFVIFRVNTPTNTNMNKSGDVDFNFIDDIKSKATIVKAFDLREGTPIGNYIKRYVEQKDFKYDQSIYVNFSSHEIYYYGIDRSQGVLTQKVENFEEQLLNNDNTILKADDWITGGFERNNLIFPYIINFEFLFDDTVTEEYKFARYFGMYCNDIDLCDLEVVGFPVPEGGNKADYTVISTNTEKENIIEMDDDSFYYIKDKSKDIFSISNTYVSGLYKIPGNIITDKEQDKFKGFESASISVQMERLTGAGYATLIFEITSPGLKNGDEVRIIDGISEQTLGTFIATSQYDPGTFYDNRYSCQGDLTDNARALAGAIRNCNSDSFKWITSFNIDNYVVIRASYPGENLNGLFTIKFDDMTKGKVNLLNEEFSGGTDIDGCIFKVLTEDKNMFFNDEENARQKTRYLKGGLGRTNAEILAFLPYINEEGKIDDTYSIIVTDRNGPYVNISKTGQAEIIDKFYAKIGVLSFFPVKDFDFDTISSVYGEYSKMAAELNNLDISAYNNTEDSDSDNDNYYVSEIKYNRFSDENGAEINNEYEYFYENILPELTTMNKTVPFVAKWGYADEGKDSCENPYRLNMSKMFEACNFSANTFMQRGDIMEYTHSMPYYVTGKNPTEKDYDEYQYIPYTVEGGIWSYNYRGIEQQFSRTDMDVFSLVFGDTSTTIYGSKRFNKKYSRFLFGDVVNNSSTMFRGVKFDITEVVNGKEVKTGKYNNYRFSFVYIPVDDDNADKAIHFIKNDTFKFIVGVVYFNIRNSEEHFNKALIYAGAMGHIKTDEDIEPEVTEMNTEEE